MSEPLVLERASDGDGLDPIIGTSPALQRAVHLARRFAATDVPVLLVGATGTGKELFAQHIHAWSGRRGELVDVNCGALPSELLESVLFGHRRGAFTGAVEEAQGLVEAADGGTLFLDELCSMPAGAQVKLLRVLEFGEVRRLGETRKRRVDFRLVAATQERLLARLADGGLRMDLIQRAAGVVVELPTLSDRPEDISTLAERFAGWSGLRLAAGVEAVLTRYSWPGNVRELSAVVERARWLSPGPEISASAIAEAIELGAPVSGHAEVSPWAADACVAREALLDVGRREGWHAERMAAAMGIHRATLFRRLKASGFSLSGLRESHQSRDSRATPATPARPHRT